MASNSDVKVVGSNADKVRAEHENKMKKGFSAMQKVKHNIEVISDHYFGDMDSVGIQKCITDDSGKDNRKDESMIDSSIESWKIASTMLAYHLRMNVLLEGEPGWGKTTLASIIACAGSGIPMDFYRKALIHGHPDQSEDKMIGRLDFGKLMDKEEKVIWQRTLYPPVVIIDEFNRLPEGKQSELLDAIDTSLFSAFNDTFYNGKKCFIATANYSDGGNTDIIPPNRDRFAFSLELNCPGGLYFEAIRRFSLSAVRDLSNPVISDEMIKALKDKSTPLEQKLNKMASLSGDFKDQLSKRCDMAGKERDHYLMFLSPDEEEDLRYAIHNLPFDDMVGSTARTMARHYMSAIIDDFNFTKRYGHKRSCDPVDSDTHGMSYASAKINSSLSQRAIESILAMSKAAAVYTARDCLDMHCIQSVAPYCLSHRIRLSQDFEATLQDVSRDESLSLKASKELVDMVATNFGNIKEKVKMLDLFLHNARKTDGSESQLKGVLKDSFSQGVQKDFKEMMADYGKTADDHPLIREYSNLIISKYPTIKNICGSD